MQNTLNRVAEWVRGESGRAGIMASIRFPGGRFAALSYSFKFFLATGPKRCFLAAMRMRCEGLARNVLQALPATSQQLAECRGFSVDP